VETKVLAAAVAAKAAAVKVAAVACLAFRQKK